MTRAYRILFLSIFLTVVHVMQVGAQTEGELIIKTPQAGEALQGIVTINGSVNMAGFLFSEVAFAYAGDTTGTWFLIAALNNQVTEGTLATWDTTTITDGNYILRLRVYLDDGSFHDVTVRNLRVRNYTPVETPTPAPTSIRPTLVPTITLTPTPFPTPTLLPTNPAILTPANVSMSVGYGGLAAIILLIVLGSYLWLRRK